MKKNLIFMIGVVLALSLLWQPTAAAKDTQKGNPFFKAYTTPFQMPPFGQIKEEHYLPAFQEGMKREAAEIDAIARSKKAPTFANTLAAMDHSGIFLGDVSAVFYALLGADTTPGLQAIAREVSPLLSAHRDNINLNERLFARVKAVYDRRAILKLSPEESHLLENSY